MKIGRKIIKCAICSLCWQSNYFIIIFLNCVTKAVVVVVCVFPPLSWRLYLFMVVVHVNVGMHQMFEVDQ